MSEKAMLFIHAQTSLHPGSGTALGTVDLPVQRERHTQWPVIPASSLKGVLRDSCRRANAEDEKRLAVFGPETADAAAHAGALALTDARILAFPVRSLRGVFAWTTCPAVLERLDRDLALAGMTRLGSVPNKPDKERAACAGQSPLLVDGDKLVLEEFEFRRTGDGDAAAVAEWIATNAVDDAATRERLKAHLVVLHDDDFTHFVRHATEVVARVGLDYERKTVKQGALFYQEFLPPETIFYSLVIAEESRREKLKMSAADVLGYLRSNMPRFLQIGGDETIGKGLCAVRIVTGDGKGA